MPKLTVRKIETVRGAGIMAMATGSTSTSPRMGAKSWILRTVVHAKRRDIGLGSASWWDWRKPEMRRGRSGRSLVRVVTR